MPNRVKIDHCLQKVGLSGLNAIQCTKHFCKDWIFFQDLFDRIMLILSAAKTSNCYI